MSNRPLSAAFVAALFSLSFASARADGMPAAEEKALSATTDTTTPEPASAEVAPAENAPAPDAVKAPEKPAAASKKGARVERAESFVAPANWEFDGYLSGGKDQEVRSMFYLNDLVYVNVGTQQGFNTGDKVNFYKRGQKVRDPQTGRVLGFEVRRAASGLVTDHTESNTCSVRILKANEDLEIGDLVKKED